jgi:hypothetical protein
MATQTNTQSQDMLAKLLATENINIIRSNIKTAAFDIKGRTLLLPRWKEMTPTIEEMLMMHEVGHALYTSADTYGVVFEEKKHLKDYANVIEDVRIEKKMKERYPGSRKSFNTGYRELNDRDFFGVKDRDLSKLLLIDRINLYFKVGFNCGVQFNAEEQELIRRVDKCSTEKEVVDLAEEIFAYSKDVIKEKIEKRKAANVPSQGEEVEDADEDDESSMYDDYIDSDEDDEEQEKPQQQSSKPQPTPTDPEQEIMEDLKPTTLQKFDEKLEQLADESLIIRYFEPALTQTREDIIVSYKKIMPDLAEALSDNVLLAKSRIAKFKSNSSGMVNYLVKEFEMRKSATAYKRAKISKLGQLDSRKLYAYKIKDDLFRQIMTVQDGKKHGMVFLLDWSGSMSSYMEETIEQVMNLAMFCQRIQIPYQVFAFTDGYYDEARKTEPRVVTTNANGLSGHVHLLELFSNKMSNVEFNKMVDYMMCKPYSRVRKYSLQGTPLNQALLFMVDYLGKFIANNGVEKTTFITLTDGEGVAIYGNENSRIMNGPTHEYDDRGQYKKVNIKTYFRDPITKKDYELGVESHEQTGALLKIIRDRHQVKSVAFFIMDSTQRATGAFVRINMPTGKGSSDIDLSNSILSSMRKDKFCILKTVPGRDEMYLLPSTSKIQDDSLGRINEDMSAASIARVLGSSMNARKTSRIVLNKFIGMVA